MAKRKTIEEKYNENIRKQQRILDDFIAHETEWANDLMLWYRVKKLEMPEDEYRGVSYFLNKEFTKKTGSLSLLYETSVRCDNELPEFTKELAFDLVRFKYKMYSAVLEKGGYGGTTVG
ncbi:MAG: hypothetical protein FWD14_05000 [Treponema sp.]|nr:hypothetical protein [Treponema sp.]